MTDQPDTSPENVARTLEGLRIKAAMIALGEKIAWGSDTQAMNEAADMLEALAARVAEVEAQYAHVLGHANRQEDRAEAAEAKLAASEARVEKLRAALADLVACQGNDPCRYDHHGYCQEHYIEADCSVKKARAALEETKP
jgi:DNA repair ATPase RecN